MIDLNIRNITELSKRSGVNRNTLSDVISGKAKPSSHVMEALIETLDLSPDEAGQIFFKRELT